MSAGGAAGRESAKKKERKESHQVCSGLHSRLFSHTDETGEEPPTPFAQDQHLTSEAPFFPAMKVFSTFFLRLLKVFPTAQAFIYLFTYFLLKMKAS